MSDDRKLAEIIATWRARREAGEAIDLEEAVRARPDRAADLRRAFEALALLDRAAAETLPRAVAEVLAGDVGEPAFPARVGDFRLLKPIGLGATGNVYEAEQVSMHRRVALKILHPSMTLNPKAVERFRREAQVAGRLHHTHIVPVHAMGTDGGLSWFAMELVEGHPLSRVIEDLRLLKRAGTTARESDAEPTPPSSSAFGASTGRRDFHERIARAFAGVADALDAAHAAGVIHRDVKPSNLLLDTDGTLKVLDFGLARASEDGLPALTMTGDVVGTPSYMSPEQVKGAAVDGRTDVYGLGATLYELLTLAPPHKGWDVAECLRRILDREPVAPRRLEPRIPRDLETIVLKALEKDPARRYPSAAALAEDLRAFADRNTIAARRRGPIGRAWRRVRRHPVRAGLVAALVLVTAGAIVLAREAEKQREAGRREAARRRDMLYDRLLSESAASAPWTRLPTASAGDARDPIEEALALAPERPQAWYLRALVRSGPGALEDLDAARQRGLAETAWRLARALVLRASGRGEEARIEQSLAGGADATAVPEVRVLRAALAVGDGRNDEALRLLDDVLGEAQAHPSTLLRARMWRARALTQKGDLEAAIGAHLALRDALAPDIAVPWADACVCDLWRQLGHKDAAGRHLEKVLAEYDERGVADSYVTLARNLNAFGDGEGTRRVLDRGLERFPEDVGLKAAYLPLLPAADRIVAVDRILAGLDKASPLRPAIEVARASWLTDDLDQPEQALSILDGLAARLAKAGPLPVELLSARCVALRRLGRPAEAEAAYKDALAGWPGNRGLIVGLAGLLTSQDRWQELLDLTSAALEGDATNLWFSDYRTTALQGLGRAADALEAARRTLALARGRQFHVARLSFPPTSVAILGAVDPAAVLECLQAAVARSPTDPWARAALAGYLLQLGRTREAFDVLDQAGTPTTTDLGLMVKAGAALNLARYAEAAEASRALVARFPEHPNGHVFLGTALLRLDNFGGALEALGVALERCASFRGGARKSGQGEAYIATRWGPAPPGLVAQIHVKRLIALARLGREAEAEQAAEAAVAAYGDPLVLSMVADAWGDVGHPARAEAITREALARVGAEKAPPQWHCAHAFLLLALDRREDARDAAERGRAAAAADVASNALTCASLSWSFEPSPTQAGREVALRLAKAAVERDPEKSNAYIALAAAQAASGEWTKAAASWDRAIELQGDQVDWPEVLLVRARIEAGRGERAAAGDLLKRARALWRYANYPLAHRLAAELERDLVDPPPSVDSPR